MSETDLRCPKCGGRFAAEWLDGCVPGDCTWDILPRAREIQAPAESVVQERVRSWALATQLQDAREQVVYWRGLAIAIGSKP